MKYAIDGSTLTEIADAVRSKTNSSDTYEVTELAEAISEISDPSKITGDIPYPIYDTSIEEGYTPWVRPAEYPNLELLPFPTDGSNCVYFTINNTLQGINAIGLYTPSGNMNIDIGHIEGSIFVTDRTIGLESNTVIYFEESDGDYPILRVTSSGALFRQTVCTIPADKSPNGVSISTISRHARVVEVYGSIPKFTALGNTNGTAFGGKYCERIKLINCDNVKSLHYAFYENSICQELILLSNTTIDITGSASNAFNGMNSIKKIIAPNLSFKNCAVASSLFNACNNLMDVDFDIEISDKCTALDNAFYGCRKFDFSRTDFSKWDTSKVKSFSNTFRACMSLKSIDISNFSFNSATTLTCMFYGCTALESLQLPDYANGINITAIDNLFYLCNNLQGEINLSNWNLQSVKACYTMFSDCWKIQKINLGAMKLISNSTSTTYSGTYTMFKNCYSLKELIWDMSECDITISGGISSTYENCYSLESPLDWSFFKGCLYATSMGSMFKNCYKVPSITFASSEVRMPKLVTMVGVFSGCHSLKKIDMSGFNIPSEVTLINAMFQYCFNLEEVALPSLDLSSNTSCANLFEMCYKLKEIPSTILNMSCSKCTSLNNAFPKNYSLKELDLSNITNCNNITSVSTFASECINLESLDMSSINTTKCTGSQSNTYPSTLKRLKQNESCKIVTTGLIPSSCVILEEWHPSILDIGFTINACDCLDDASINRMINQLSTRTVATTIKVGSHLMQKITAAQVATITSKGWTLAI